MAPGSHQVGPGQYSTVQYSAVQCSTVQYSTVQERCQPWHRAATKWAQVSLFVRVYVSSINQYSRMQFQSVEPDIC